MASTTDTGSTGSWGPALAADERRALSDHGDTQAPSGTLDLAVNVLADTPDWLRSELARVDLAAYPRADAATAAAAASHGVDMSECLLTNGAAEAFWALAQALRPRRAVCVHPSFTAPEAALRASEVPVRRAVRAASTGFSLDPSQIPTEADLVVLGRPDNPTGRMESVDVVRGLTRPGRVVVVDEAFADFLPDAAGIASLRLPGVVCVRSLTKLWGLAGLRVGYLLGDPSVLHRVAAHLQPWSVNSLAVHAVTRLCAPEAQAERRARAERVAVARRRLVDDLTALAGGTLPVWPSPANFVLVHTGVRHARDRLLEHGVAARRCDTFPGLDDTYLRLAVPLGDEHRERLVAALAHVLGNGT